MDRAHGLSGPRERVVQALRVALVAAELGWEDLVRQWLLELPSPMVRARLQWALLEMSGELPPTWVGPRSGSAGPPGGSATTGVFRSTAGATLSLEETEVAALLTSLARTLVEARRWVPLDSVWLRRDDALSAVALAAGRRGLGPAVAALQAELCEETPGPRARMAVARLWLGSRAGDSTTAGRWDAAVRLVRAVGDVHHRVELVRELARVAVEAGERGRVKALLPTARPVGHGELVVAEALADALCGARAWESAAEVWSWMVDHAVVGAPEDQRLTECLVRVAARQEQVVGPVVGELSWTRAVHRIRTVALPPDPRTRGPWSVLVAAALERPQWSTHLRAAFRAQPVLPPAWAAALGLLEIHGGHPERARSIAEALAASQPAWGDDVEPGALAALLFSQLGDGDRALETMRSVLERVGGRRIVLAPVGWGGPGCEVERLFVESLARHNRPDMALELARMVAPERLRLSLLAGLAGAFLGRDAGDRDGLLAELRDGVGRGAGLDSVGREDLPRLLRVLLREGDVLELRRLLLALGVRCRSLPWPMRVGVCAAVLDGCLSEDCEPIMEVSRSMVGDLLEEDAGEVGVVEGLAWLAATVVQGGTGDGGLGPGLGQDQGLS